MRVASLLPSLTELVADLGRGGDLVGVTHECDHPDEVVRDLPRLTSSSIPSDASSAEIDRLVAELGGQLYRLDAARLADLRPDLILTQAQCDVCAVNEATVRQVAAGLDGRPPVESVNPLDLAGVFSMFRRVGDLLGARPAADAIVARFESSAAEIGRRVEGRPRPRVVLLEWPNPPYLAGHWIPEILGLAGGVEALGKPGEPSRRVAWSEVRRADPEVVLLSPCGFDLGRVEAELRALDEVDEWRSLPAVRVGRVALVDGNRYFSRPGPRLEASLRIAAAAIHPDACGDLAPEPGWGPPGRFRGTDLA